MDSGELSASAASARVPRIAEQRNRVSVNGNAIELGRTNIASPLFRIRTVM